MRILNNVVHFGTKLMNMRPLEKSIQLTNDMGATLELRTSTIVRAYDLLKFEYERYLEGTQGTHVAMDWEEWIDHCIQFDESL